MRKFYFSVLILLGFFFIVGFNRPEPTLQEYQRTPLSIRLKRLLKAGRDLYLRRRYEDALAVFEAMQTLDPNNIDAIFWRKKIEDRLFREKNEAEKAEIIRKQGSLKVKESGYENWVWGPTVGHFEIRYSKPKPRIIPPKKVRPPASDEEIQKAKEAAKNNDPQALFNLAMLYNSRKEFKLALDALEKAADLNPDILAQDDEGLTATILQDFQKALEKGTATPQQRIFAARVALIQGDLPEAIIQFIKAASKDESLKTQAKEGLKKIIDSGKTAFLQRLPEINCFQQAYIFQEKHDKVFLWINFTPNSPLYIFPFDLEFEQAAIKEIKNHSKDILFIIPDPFTIDTTRLWVVGSDPDDRVKNLTVKAEIILDSNIITELKLSNYLVEPTLPANWSLVFGLKDSFGPGFSKPKIEKEENGIVMKGFQLLYTHGKGPTLFLPNFRKSLPQKVDVWKEMEKIRETEGYIF